MEDIEGEPGPSLTSMIAELGRSAGMLPYPSSFARNQNPSPISPFHPNLDPFLPLSTPPVTRPVTHYPSAPDLSPPRPRDAFSESASVLNLPSRNLPSFPALHPFAVLLRSAHTVNPKPIFDSSSPKAFIDEWKMFSGMLEFCGVTDWRRASVLFLQGIMAGGNIGDWKVQKLARLQELEMDKQKLDELVEDFEKFVKGAEGGAEFGGEGQCGASSSAQQQNAPVLPALHPAGSVIGHSPTPSAHSPLPITASSSKSSLPTITTQSDVHPLFPTSTYQSKRKPGTACSACSAKKKRCEEDPAGPIVSYQVSTGAPISQRRSCGNCTAKGATCVYAPMKPRPARQTSRRNRLSSAAPGTGFEAGVAGLSSL